MTIGLLTLELLNSQAPELLNSRASWLLAPGSWLLAKFPLARNTSGC